MRARRVAQGCHRAVAHRQSEHEESWRSGGVGPERRADRRKSGSQWTRRWREEDSNPWSHSVGKSGKVERGLSTSVTPRGGDRGFDGAAARDERRWRRAQCEKARQPTAASGPLPGFAGFVHINKTPTVTKLRWDFRLARLECGVSGKVRQNRQPVRPRSPPTKLVGRTRRNSGAGGDAGDCRDPAGRSRRNLHGGIGFVKETSGGGRQ